MHLVIQPFKLSKNFDISLFILLTSRPTPGYSPYGSGNLKLLSQNYETSQSTTGWGGNSDRANDGNTDGYWGAG